ncbi:uncharacterized protein LOC121377467 [Gigantopelta aegis]|uniref:uncharacterized protein LOC121377467 n=1 Tax=Gigantopelta aegis TaxID=1735272 RepID=UPI001B888B3A|nr:uncharacterized protein LOC121377467 [Gigantopelta aegis]
MLVGCWWLATLILVVPGSEVFASHFRGAQITWKSLDGPGVPENTVQITHRIAWRRSYSSSTRCDASTVESGSIIGINDQLLCRIGCSGTVGSMTYQCTDFSVTEDWSAGEKTYNFTFPNNGNFEVSYTGGDWISLVQGGGNWEVRMKLNLTTRNDTGLVNSSPRTAMTPIVRLQHRCNHTLTIPVNDPDHDFIRCRWAEASKSECAGVCKTFPGAEINERDCTIKYSATRRAGWYAVALMIEDFETAISDTPLSSIPLQFLVFVFTSNANCSSQPEFIGDTRADESCVGVPTGTMYFEKIVVKSGRPTTSIIDITTVSPVGLEKSALSVLEPQVWYVNITWTPTSSQDGPNIFCFTAIDNTGQTTTQRCITLLGGVDPPQFQVGSQYPTGMIYPNHSNWRINIDQDFLRPNRSNFIRFHDSAGDVKYSIDVAITSAVVYPVGGFGRQLSFTTKFLFKEKETYYITLDPGIVKGTTFCGAESPRIRDPSFWKITIRDVTPPSVVFEVSPRRSNANVSIMWVSDEETTYICTVQNPSGVPRNVDCNNTYIVTGIQQEGYYSIFVQGTDTAGNTARPIRHTWFVDLTPPVVNILQKPASVSNEKTPRIYFSCNDRGCTYRCKLVGRGQSGNDVVCTSGYRLPGTLEGGQFYTFSVRATDDVGNEGAYMAYTWQTDFNAPTILSVAAAVVNCGDDYGPDTLGRPVVTDNIDPLPMVTVNDTPSTGCTVRRLWEATDSAGNTASTIQRISFTSPKPAHISAPARLVVACNQFPDSTQSTDDDLTIDVTHPCNRSVVITHTDSVSSIRCGTTFTRNWVVTDDCGEVTRFQQTIQILALQYPDYPQNGQRNVDLKQRLAWPQYPGKCYTPPLPPTPF